MRNKLKVNSEAVIDGDKIIVLAPKTTINKWYHYPKYYEAICYYTVGHEKTRHVYFCDNSGKYWPIFVIFFTAIYNNELRNKNLLKIFASP